MLVALFCSGLSASGAQQPPRAQPPTPTFGVATDVVLVDVVVTGERDRPVTGLTAADFVVKEDGKTRPIVSFAAFENETRASAGPREVVVEPYATPESEPESMPNSVAVLFVDDGQLSPQNAMRMRAPLKRLLDELIERNGALALVAPWSSISIANEVEGNRAVFAAAIDKINGRRNMDYSTYPISDAEAIAIERGDPAMMGRLVLRFISLNPGLDSDQAPVIVRGRATEVAADARIRRKDAYGVLLRSLDWLVKQPGRHSIIMVSGGYAVDYEDDEQRQVITRSLEARAPIHFLDARGLAGFGMFSGVEFGPALPTDAGETPFAFSEAAQGASDLALDTGGIVLRNTNNFDRGLERVLDTMTIYYVIGYEPPVNPKPGFRKIEVEVKGKGLKVQARRGYLSAGRRP